MSQKLVLLLNDDEALSFSIKIELKGRGVRAVSKTCVAEALKFLSENGVDAIVSDINLGDGMPSGYDFLTEVRKKDKDIPFIFISGYPKAKEWPKAEATGATGYLQIPFEDGELEKILGV